jgi:uncharacterized phage infection (PIP) family protein YhgE
MDEKYIEESVRDVIEDLKVKIETLSQNCEDSDESVSEKLDVIKEKAVKVFNDAAVKLNAAVKQVSDEKELEQAIATVREKSKEFYDNAMERISEVKKQAVKKIDSAEKTDLVEDVKKGVSDFMNREDVRETVDKAKAGAVDIAERTLDILKGWLLPDGEDK